MPRTPSDWWNSISLRTKLTGVTVLLMTIGLVVSGFGTITVLKNYLVETSDRQLLSVVQSVSAAPVTRDDVEAEPPPYVVAGLDSTGRAVYENQNWTDSRVSVQPGRLDSAFVRANSGRVFTLNEPSSTDTYRMVVAPARAGSSAQTIVIGLSLEPINRTIAQLFSLFFLFGVLVVLLGAVLTRILVGSTFAPLKQVERTAAAIADGDFGQRLGNVTPNTEVGRLNRSLNRMLNRIDGALADRARTIEQMRRFVGDASHELRTPLVSVRGYAELYRMGALQSREDVAQAMDRIEREAVRLGVLVSDLLALARLDESRPLKRTEVELLPLAHDAALDARALAPKRTIRVVGHDPDVPTGTIEILRPVLPPAASATTTGRVLRRAPADAQTTGAMRLTALLRSRRRREDAAADDAVRSETGALAQRPVVLGEEDKLRQVLTNLMGNAIRFTPDDSPIEIAAYADVARSLAVLEVVDHGEGIPPQVRDKIFQRFWRADSSRTRDTGGSGLGLAIVASIVAAHEGSITISETAGGGATFRVTLPLLHSPQDDDDLHSPDPEPAMGLPA